MDSLTGGYTVKVRCVSVQETGVPRHHRDALKYLGPSRLYSFEGFKGGGLLIDLILCRETPVSLDRQYSLNGHSFTLILFMSTVINLFVNK